jgi:hypothetical protein
LQIGAVHEIVDARIEKLVCLRRDALARWLLDGVGAHAVTLPRVANFLGGGDRFRQS